MHSIACCPTININLAGDVKNKQGSREGVYVHNGTINGRDYWVKVGGGNAMWYYPRYKHWLIGPEKVLGSENSAISSVEDLESTCPHNLKNNWIYFDEGWISTNDVELLCIGNQSY